MTRSTMQTRTTRRPRAAGFSLTELLIAATILGLGMLMVASAFPVAFRQVQDTVQWTGARGAVRTAFDVLQMRCICYNDDYSDNDGTDFVGDPVPSGPGDGRFHVLDLQNWYFKGDKGEENVENAASADKTAMIPVYARVYPVGESDMEYADVLDKSLSWTIFHMQESGETFADTDTSRNFTLLAVVCRRRPGEGQRFAAQDDGTFGSNSPAAAGSSQDWVLPVPWLVQLGNAGANGVSVSASVARLLPPGAICFVQQNGFPLVVTERPDSSHVRFRELPPGGIASAVWVFPPALRCQDNGDRVSNTAFEDECPVVAFFFKGNVAVSNGD